MRAGVGKWGVGRPADRRPDCRPLHAIEFQGTGHHQNAAAERDAVKKEALRRAGIGYVEVVSGDTPAELRAMVRKLAGRAG